MNLSVPCEVRSCKGSINWSVIYSVLSEPTQNTLIFHGPTSNMLIDSSVFLFITMLNAFLPYSLNVSV